MVVAHHLCGRYGHIMLLRRKSVSGDVVKSKTFGSTFSTFFFFVSPVEMTCLVPVSTTESRSLSPAVHSYLAYVLVVHVVGTCTYLVP